MASVRFLRSTVSTAVILGLLAVPRIAAAQSLPDLHPRWIEGPPYVSAGQTVHLEECIENIGSKGTGVFNVKWLVDGQEVGAYGSHSGVPAHASVCNGNSFFNWKVPNDPGSHHEVTFIVDIDNHVRESDETNNSASDSFEVVVPPA